MRREDEEGEGGGRRRKKEKEEGVGATQSRTYTRGEEQTVACAYAGWTADLQNHCLSAVPLWCPCDAPVVLLSCPCGLHVVRLDTHLDKGQLVQEPDDEAPGQDAP